MRRDNYRELSRYRTVQEARGVVEEALHVELAERFGEVGVEGVTDDEVEFTVLSGAGRPVLVTTTVEVSNLCVQEVESFEDGEDAISFTVCVMLSEGEGRATRQETYALRTLKGGDNPVGGIEWAVGKVEEFLDMEFVFCGGCGCEIGKGTHCGRCEEAIREDYR